MIKAHKSVSMASGVIAGTPTLVASLKGLSRPKAALAANNAQPARSVASFVKSAGKRSEPRTKSVRTNRSATAMGLKPTRICRSSAKSIIVQPPPGVERYSGCLVLGKSRSRALGGSRNDGGIGHRWTNHQSGHSCRQKWIPAPFDEL